MDKITPLPSLSTVRVFEATARRLSFTRAAEELGMTQAAVSYQIKTLEERIGAPVFRRVGRGIALTRAGERLSTAASEAMAILRDAFAEVNEGDDVLAITALPTLAATWLAPRLGGFQYANPQLALRLDTTNRLIDLAHEDFDIGLRAGVGEWPGMEGKRLFPSLYTPLCSPCFLAERGLTHPEQLRALPLIGEQCDWQFWFHAAGLEAEDGEIRPRLGYETQQFDVAAAMGGQGVALASPIFFAGEVAAGRLVRPFPETVWRERNDYWLVYPHARRLTPKIAAFRDWLLAAVAADPVIAEETARLSPAW